MEFLLIPMIMGALIAVPIWMAVSISRHSSEIRGLRNNLAKFQGTLDWLIDTLQKRDEAFTLPVQPVPSPPVPKPHEIGVPEYLAGSRPQTAEAAPQHVQPAAAVPEPIGRREPGVPEYLAGIAGQAPRVPGQTTKSEWWGDFEQAIGKRWLTWVGVLILIIAAAFAVKYLYDVGLLGPWVRIALELALGGLILLMGRYALQHKMVALGQGLLGLGLAVFYITTYSAYYFHQLLTAPVDLLLIAAVTGAGLLISLRYDALAVAVLSTIGGLITPELVSRGVDLQHVLFTYILVLDLGVLALALFKRWRLLDTVAFIGTALIFAGWLSIYYSAVLLVPTVAWLGAFFVLFLLLPYVSSRSRNQPLAVEQLLLVLANAVLTITAGWHLLLPAHKEVLGCIVLLMALLYLLLAVEFRHRQPVDRSSHSSFIVLAIFCTTLSVLVLLSFNVITVVWALEAPLLVLLGYFFSDRLVRNCGFVMLIVALLRVLIVHLPLHQAAFNLFLNPQFGAAAFVPLAAAATALVHWRFSSSADRLDNAIKLLCGVGAGLLGLLLINHELSLWFSHNWPGPYDDERYYSLTTMVLLWISGSTLFMLAGLYWRSRAARAVALLLLLVPVVLGVWAYAELQVAYLPEQGGYLLFANYRFIAALIAVLLIMAMGWLHSQLAVEVPADELVLPALFGITGGLLGLLLFASEIGCWWSVNVTASTSQLLASLSWQGLVWAIGAALFLLAGIRLNSNASRWSGVVPLVVGLFTLVRAYVIGNGEQWPELLFANLRFTAAIAVILVIYAYGVLMRRRRDICHAGEQQLATAAYVAGNLLLLLLLSTEIYGYCESLVLPDFQEDQLAHLSLSVLWGAYALAFIVVGFWLSKRVLRLWALGLFGFTALKLLVIDLGYLEPAYRLLSTVVLGLLMIATSYLYHRLEKRLRDLPAPSSAGREQGAQP